MTSVRVGGFSVARRFGAEPEQSLENPLGKRGLELHQWLFGTRMFRTMIGQDGGSDGVDDAYAHRSMAGFGAFILGRNMFGPIRGPWLDETWNGWWGANPPYHAPTFGLLATLPGVSVVAGILIAVRRSLNPTTRWLPAFMRYGAVR